MNREETKSLRTKEPQLPPEIGLATRDLDLGLAGVQDQGKSTLFPRGRICSKHTHCFFYICMLLDYFNITTSYTFETKSNKVPLPEQHELRMPFPFK